MDKNLQNITIHIQFMQIHFRGAQPLMPQEGLDLPWGGFAAVLDQCGHMVADTMGSEGGDACAFADTLEQELNKTAISVQLASILVVEDIGDL